MCEAGESGNSTLVPQLSGVHDQGLVVREDFESYDEANSLIWSEINSGAVSDQCGAVLHGKAATFCKPTGPRSLTTLPLNTTTASTLQFALGVGNCTVARGDPPITVFYSSEKCSKWHELEQINLQPSVETTVHILCLPPSAKATDVCIRWHQGLDSGSYKGCWAVDNIIISSVSDLPTLVEETFDPVDPGNFLFFPGGEVKKMCNSEGNALIFHGSGNHRRQVITRDLDMSTSIASEDVIFNEMFNQPLNSWVVKGGEVTSRCEISNYRNSLLMSGKGTRIFCTPYTNALEAGNLRFHFLYGGYNCSSMQPNSDMSHNTPVLVYAETSSGEQTMLIDVIHASLMEVTTVSVPIPSEAQTSKTRFCWSQAANGGQEKDVWAVDNVLLLPRLQKEITHVFNFKVNLQCGQNFTVNEIVLEYSTTSGHSWHTLHEMCLPPICNGTHSAQKSRLTSHDVKVWNKVSYPLPYASLVDGVRFRIKQLGKYRSSNWAIDD